MLLGWLLVAAKPMIICLGASLYSSMLATHAKERDTVQVSVGASKSGLTIECMIKGFTFHINTWLCLKKGT